MSELSRVIESVGKDRGIKKEIIVEALENAVLVAAQKKLGAHAILEAHYNQDSGEIEVFHFKKVVESEPEMLDESEEIEISEAKKLDAEITIGDEIGIKLDSSKFGRIDAQTAKQVIFQKVRHAERDIIFNEYTVRKEEIVTGIARRIERGNLIIDLGKTDAILTRSGIIPGEQFKPGDRVQAFLEDVTLAPRGPQLILSRTSPKYLIKLFESEVPEIRDGIVTVMGCAREPGIRSKISVTSKDRDVDPVGACVGLKGNRVQNIIQELKGEKIDIIPWSDNPAIFVRAALSPAEISSVHIDERNKMMEITVEDSQLSLAIGKRGQNVRLASQITHWRLDILSKSKAQKRTTDALFNLQNLEGISETTAKAIIHAGFQNIRQIVDASLDGLQKITGFEATEAAEELKKKAIAFIEKAGDLLNIGDNAETDVTMSPKSGKPEAAKDAKTLASERLREMIKQASNLESKK